VNVRPGALYLQDVRPARRRRAGGAHGRVGRALAKRNGAPGAIVIGGDYQGLGIVRSLGRRGVDVLVVDDERSLGRRSRYATAAVTVPDLRDEEATVASLLELGERHGLDGWVVFPTREETVAALSRHRERLLRRFRVPTPPWEVVKWAWDKRNTYELATELGIATPRSWRVGGVEELDAVDAEPPFAVKPAIKEHFLYATGEKAWRADSRAELAARVRAAAQLVGAEEVIVQELIPGGGEAQLGYCAFFRDGRAAASMTVRRLRQHPPLFGRASTFVQTIEQPQLAELSERFLRHIGYYGLVEMEYKHDARDGHTKLLDVNARTWGYHSLGQRAGVDFPYLLYAHQLAFGTSDGPGAAPDGPHTPPNGPHTTPNGLRAAPNGLHTTPHGLRTAPDGVHAAPGVSWIRLATDLPTAALELKRGTLDWRAYLRTLRAADTESVFSRDDPLPGLAELALLPYLAVRRGL
jgi:D-aspartate ligase